MGLEGRSVSLAVDKMEQSIAMFFGLHGDCERKCTAFGMALLRNGGMFEEEGG